MDIIKLQAEKTIIKKQKLCNGCNIKVDEETSVYKNNNKQIVLCDGCYQNILNSIEKHKIYRDSLEQLKKEFGKLINLAEKATITNKNKLPLQVRKQSIVLRELLKEFRVDSIEHEKFLKDKESSSLNPLEYINND